ncbi:hypothetical protein CKO37_09805 [Rubrivivax gelatinosus]|nr:hypothetical protein [Rubrivivax gelatinosus]
MLVVMAVVALLAALAMPSYFIYVDRARETVLRHNIKVLRERIDQFYSDRSRYPRGLDELVRAGYLREIPIDPMTERPDTWKTISPSGQLGEDGGVADVRSGAVGRFSDGTAYEAF